MALTSVPLRARDIESRDQAYEFIRLALAERHYVHGRLRKTVASRGHLFVRPETVEGATTTSNHYAILIRKFGHGRKSRIEVRPLEAHTGHSVLTFLMETTGKACKYLVLNRDAYNLPPPQGQPGGPFLWHELLPNAELVRLGYDPKELRKERGAKRYRAGPEGISRHMRGETPARNPVPHLIPTGTRYPRPPNVNLSRHPARPR
jgi:hypothetical protein